MVSIFSKAEISSQRSKFFDSPLDQDGLKIEYDIRVDEEQKYNEVQIFDLLIAAGYFRARIEGLDSFDKVVGGMTWCISLSNYEVDVDLLFLENSTIRHKIAITEKIVYLLPVMQCPHRLEPHQIQGLDYIHIFPVVQWLVRKAIETRSEIGNAVRSFSVFQFNKDFLTNFTGYKIDLYCNIDNLQSDLFPYRRFRRTILNKEVEIESKVLLTLLEYGQNVAYRSSRSSILNPNSTKNIPEKSNLLANNNSTNNPVLDMLNELSEIKNEQPSLSKNILGSIVGLQADSISFCNQAYNTQRGSTVKNSLSNIRIIESLKKQVAILDKSHLSKNLILDDILTKFNAIKSKVKSCFDKDVILRNELTQIMSKEAELDSYLLQRLMGLVSIHDQLVSHEKEFDTQSKDEVFRIVSEIEELKKQNLNGNKDSFNDLEKFRKQRIVDDLKFKKSRAHIAKKTRDIASFQRKIDDIPSRAELAQYQRRFVELHKFVSGTLTETRQFFTLYNTLNDTKIFLSKESELLNIIYDKFDTALTSQNNRDIYIKHIDQFLNQTFNNLAKLQEKKSNSKDEKDSLNDILVSLLDQQRQYSRLIRDFSLEISHNEELVNYLSRIS